MHRDELLRRHIAHKDALHLDGLNRSRVLATRTRYLDGHKRLKMSIINGDIRRIRTALAVKVRNGAGIFGLIRTTDDAAVEAYKAQSYERSEYQRTFLLWKLGGVFAANLGYRTLGLPSIDTARREPLRASPGKPTVEEMHHNLRTAFKSWTPPARETEVLFYPASLLIDEMKLQLGSSDQQDHRCGSRRLRWVRIRFSVDSTSRSHPPRVHLASEVCCLFISVHTHATQYLPFAVLFREQ